MIDPDQDAFLTLQRAADRLMQEVDALLKAYGLSAAQFNVLRILRGAKGQLSCSEIGSRLIKQDPDVTRLLDRLESRGWISRQRSSTDRRVVHASITKAGLDLLASLDQPIVDLHRHQFSRISRRRRAELATTLKLLLGA